MRGVVLAGGAGTRLDPLTRVTNKHLLPVYDRPMIHFALEQVRSCGIARAVLVSATDQLAQFRRLLGDGSAFGLDDLVFAGQDRPGGIAEALGLAERAAEGDPVMVLLGDNLFERSLAPSASAFRDAPRGARLILARVDDPRPYGVAAFEGDRLVRVVEKPATPPSALIVTGAYFFERGVFDVVRRLRPSGRGELEITDVVNHYVTRGAAAYETLEGYWIDCGASFDALLRAARLVADRGANKAVAPA